MPPKKQRQICHAHNAGGCRRGESCNFRHVGPAGGARSSAETTSPGPSTPQRASSSTGPPIRGGRSSNNTGPRRQNPPGLPPGACRDFWEKGTCSRGDFDCKFRHISPTSTQVVDTVTSTPARMDFLTTGSLGEVAGSSSDVFTALQSHLSPTEAANHLKTYLNLTFRFTTPQNMYSFLKILNSANEKHDGWDLSDGQVC
ncbi:hypothetical protein FRC02_000586 [Tulasnella sp. 418]|nr:hypothetical protein FRC02_000586 [Tulasnella sp. 418]